MGFTLPPGFTFFPGMCQCGKPLWQVDRIEGKPVYACVDHCGQPFPSDPVSMRDRRNPRPEGLREREKGKERE
jgi:hypothetical protein